MKMDFLTPYSFDSLYKEVKGKTDNELIEMMSDKLEVIVGTYHVNVQNGVQYGSILVTLGVQMACDGIEKTLTDAKKKAFAKVFSDFLDDESDVSALVLGYKEEMFDTLKQIIKIFDSDDITKDTFLYLIGAACVGGENKKGLDNIKRLLKAWFF